MTPGLLSALLTSGLAAVALIGPWLLRRAAPALVRVPRVAAVVVVGGVVVWLGAVLAIGPVLAWVGSGPTLLAGGAADVCQRCLAAANPFVAGVTDTSIPALVFLALPAAAMAGLATAVVVQMMRQARRSRETARLLLRGAQRRRMHGHWVSVIEADRPLAFTFPVRQGGIVLSAAAVDALDGDELSAVLEHEGAHLRQHHHVVTAFAAALATSLRWVPLVAAAADALPHYLEIAADNEASRRAGTPALVSALIKLGERATSPAPALAGVGALHAAGPERIRQLVHPTVGAVGAGPALAITTSLVALGLAGAAVHLTYVAAALAGC